MSSKRKNKAPSGPRPKRPRNTVTLSLEGDERQFARSYCRCQAHLQYYFLCNSGCRVCYGDRIFYTTPLKGTFYYVLRYKGRYLVFIIIARSAWMIGFCSANGFFQMRSNEFQGNYMDSEHTKVFKFNANHKSISPDGTGSFVINLKAVRRRFNELCNYTGCFEDPLRLRANIGFFVIFIMEAKGIAIFNHNCQAILKRSNLILEDDWVHRAIRNWQTISLQALVSFDDVKYIPHDCGIRELESLDDLLGVFFYLHVDSYFSGICKHEPMDPEPRIITWDPVDDGVGDGDIKVLRESKSESCSWILSRGSKKRVSTNSELSICERRSKKPRGLCGGGLGGSPEAPQLFETWAKHNNKETCKALEAHLKLLGLSSASKKVPAQVRLKQLGLYLKGIADFVTDEGKRLSEKLENVVVSGTVDAATTISATVTAAATLDTDAAIPTSATDDDHGGATPAIEAAATISATDAATPTLIDAVNPTSADDDTSATDATSVAPTLMDAVTLTSVHDDAGAILATDVAATHVFSASDIASLGDGQFLNDAIISWEFDNLMTSLEQNGIHYVQLVDPMVSYGLYHNALDPRIINLSLRHLVLFPLNDNEDTDRADGGTHWSLLVLDLWTNRGPRLIHYGVVLVALTSMSLTVSSEYCVHFFLRKQMNWLKGILHSRAMPPTVGFL